jgi:acetyl esterase
MPAPYRLDPELAPVAEGLMLMLNDKLNPRLDGDRDDWIAEAANLRATASEMMKSFGYDKQDFPGLVVEDVLVPSLDGGPDVPARIYRQEGLAPDAPCVVEIHGGGFTQGTIYEGPSMAAALASRLPLVAIDVEYRLAPEHPAPAAVQDCYAVLHWAHAQGAAIGIDPGRIALAGHSAGGGLAAATTLMARDRGGPTVVLQLLDIPELDDRLETWSMRHFTDTPMFFRAAAQQSWLWYLGGPRTAETSIYASPSQAEDLTGLPPTYISVMEFDPLRDEGIAYATRLLQAGVTVELHLFPGTFHGSAIAAFAAVTQRWAEEFDGVVARALGIAL